MIIYDGPSLYDDESIIVVAVPDWNKKTGLMLSTWILLRDIDPVSAAIPTRGETGTRDASICGSCKYRFDPKTGKRRCYVRVDWEARVIWEKYHDGEYADGTEVPEIELKRWHKRVNPWKLPIRLGSYGDPAVVPAETWKSLVASVDDPRQHTGYTHLWDWPDVDPALRELCMASVDDIDERERAQRAGWRTFCVTTRELALEDPEELGKDILCPASKLGGRKTTCANCVLCSGNTVVARSIWIPAHGPGFAV